ncbi:MAG: hypothetical protein A2Y54_09635 [Chloroflexi bacterium RBG_16_51_16]|nr:MAG: hypothetical protein A2Y54_09635 [Chloroflexi bacterium RBG_16_51_16]
MILDLPLILDTRRNHALEHATLHVLAVKYPRQNLAGHSNPTGYFIFGNIPTTEVETAARQALRLLKLGERDLAIHNGCGTNIATMILLAGGLAWFVLKGARSSAGRLLRLPFAVGFAVVGLGLSRPLGPWLQARITTESELDGLEIVEVRRVGRGLIGAHRVITHT